MNCEHVEELLSLYLDNMLAPDERRDVAMHLQGCPRCSAVLVDYRRFDDLLFQLPRVSPSSVLRERIFSELDRAELTGTDNSSQTFGEPTRPHKRVRSTDADRPKLVALPGGRSSLPDDHVPSALTTPTLLSPSITLATQHAHRRRTLHIMRVAIVAALLLTIGLGGLIGWRLWIQSASIAKRDGGGITPPAGPQQNVPLSAGMHFVFLRDGSLWSTPVDGSSFPERLTPSTVTVAANWAVSPALPGRFAGDMLSYIDLQRAQVHIVRSDGLRDMVIQQPLLKAGVEPSTIWDTEAGTAILNSLAWSPDGRTLAFVADPTNAGQLHLYLFSTETGTVQAVALPVKGSVAHPVWSPDGVRVAFELIHNGTVALLDYNIQNQGVLTVVDGLTTSANPTDTLLTLDWSSDVNTPAITWSVGALGHIHSLWVRHVGIGGTAAPHQLILGNYVQATYSRSGHGGLGSWLLVTSSASSVIERIDLTDISAVVLTSGKHISFARWSPDGNAVDYFDALSSGVGTLHIVNLITNTDTLIASGVASQPLPAWSADSQALVYSTGKQVMVVTGQAAKQLQVLPLRGLASAFVWSTTSSHQLIISLSDGQQGVYLVDTQHNTSLQLDKQAISGPLLWNEVP